MTTDKSRMILFVAIAIIAIFSIASHSIGIKAFNDNNEYKQRNKDSFNYLVIGLSGSVLVLTGLIVYFGFIVARNTPTGMMLSQVIKSTKAPLTPATVAAYY
jgi:uncharacterized membrane protein YidH (DUF202 family)